MLKRLSCGSASVLMLALAVTLAVPRAAAAQCPTNTMSAMGTTQVSSNPSGSLAGSHTCTEGGNIHQTATSYVAYNLASGWVEAKVNGTGLCQAYSDLLTHDIFTLTGPGTGSPISFRAELSAYALAYGPSAARVTVREGASNASPSSGYDWSTVGVTITLSPGSTFDLYISGFGSGGLGGTSGDAQVDAWLGFPDLPPGYLLQSCQGFIAGAVVPVRAASWGKLKTLYR